ncbi:PKD domain-containing protein, partial [Flavobacteriales bacterium]|nr:PKD domain-containing protein [Flavobacteriales bacterium]
CGSGTAQFDGSISQYGDGSIDTWIWDFNDPNATTVNPNNVTNITNGSDTHDFGSPPFEYYVELTVEDNLGCVSATYTDTVIISPSITASFTANKVCLNDSTTLDASASTGQSGSNPAYEYEWTIYDTSAITLPPSTSPTLDYRFLTHGLHTVILTTYQYGQNTCTATDTVQVMVDTLPDPNFVMTNILDPCENDSIYFNNQTLNPSIISNYTWVLYNNSATEYIPADSNNPNVIFQFDNCGTYDIDLIAVDSNTCSNTINKQIYISCNPKADILSLFKNCDGEDILFFDNTTYDDSLDANQFIWSTNGPGSWHSTNTSGLGDTAYLYNTPGSYLISLTVIDINGCTDFTSESVTVWNNPIASINTISTVCQGNASPLIHNTIPGDTTINEYFWEFGDGNNLIAEFPIHTYDICGDYYPILRVEDDNGCSNSTDSTDLATVNCNPTAVIDAPDVCEGDKTHFDASNSLVTSGYNIDNYYWIFDINDPSLNLSTSADTCLYPYPACDSFYVSLRVTDNQSPACHHTDTIQITVNCPPTAGFSSTEECLGFCTEFTDITSPNNIVSWNWDINSSLGSFANCNSTNSTQDPKVYLQCSFYRSLSNIVCNRCKHMY